MLKDDSLSGNNATTGHVTNLELVGLAMGILHFGYGRVGDGHSTFWLGGMLMMKHHLQLACVKYPPMTGPIQYPRPPTIAKVVLFLAFSFSETLSAKMTLLVIIIPAQPAPCNALPTRSIGNACTGAPEQSVLPIKVVMSAV
jgi:hypothetical protein